MHYYNEFDKNSATMLRQMISDGLLPPADVDERPIQEIDANELKKYTQCHFFAGIGGWQYALQLAKWPATRPVWTGSCPCQPFSAAGNKRGKQDDRHLWPIWERLIKECRPATIFGEQVATAVAHGWLDDVYQGLEAQGYAVGAAVLPACSVGAPHKRDRLWFVADAEGCGQRARLCEDKKVKNGLEPCNHLCDVAHAERQRQPRQGKLGEPLRPAQGCQGKADRAVNDSAGHWAGAKWIDCPDGKQRPIEPSIPLLADGVQHRKPILHALGNAIVPQAAAEFIKASM